MLEGIDLAPIIITVVSLVGSLALGLIAKKYKVKYDQALELLKVTTEALKDGSLSKAEVEIIYQEVQELFPTKPEA